MGRECKICKIGSERPQDPRYKLEWVLRDQHADCWRNTPILQNAKLRALTVLDSGETDCALSSKLAVSLLFAFRYISHGFF